MKFENWDKLLKILAETMDIVFDIGFSKSLVALNKISINNLAYRIYGSLVYLQKRKNSDQSKKMTPDFIDFEKIDAIQDLN